MPHDSDSLVSFEPTEFDRLNYSMLRNAEKCWKFRNGRYLISLSNIAGFVHVRIRHQMNFKIEDFQLFQEIKNLVLGKDAIAVQVYPKDSDLVDGSNTYHLWTWRGIEGEVPNLRDMPRYH